jgi:hypothetical protein
METVSPQPVLNTYPLYTPPPLPVQMNQYWLSALLHNLWIWEKFEYDIWSG